MNYKIYQWKIQPKSSFVSKIKSNIILGHVIWAMKYIYGEDKLQEVLDDFSSGNAPFIFSNGFVDGYLPFFKNKTLSDDVVIEQLAYEKLISKSENKYRIKRRVYSCVIDRLDNIKYIPEKVFNDLRNGLTAKEILNDILKSKRFPESLLKVDINIKGNILKYVNNKKKYIDENKVEVIENYVDEDYTIKNSINRILNTTDKEGNSLYTLNETYYKKPINIFVKVREDIDIDMLKKSFKYIESTGFGKKSSTGKGAFETISFEEATCFDRPYEGNHFVVLSTYIPKVGDYEKAVSTNISCYKGKISGEYATRNNVFKKPIMCFEEGSLFKGKPLDNKGKLVFEINEDKDIFQCGIPFVVGVTINEK